MKSIFTPDQIAKFYATFKMFDHEKKGYIGVEDLESLFKRLNIQIEGPDIDQMISRLNPYEGFEKKITFSSFLFLLQGRIKDTNTEAHFIEAFKLFDMDGNGLISNTDLVKVFKKMGHAISEEESISMIKEFDNDGDKNLNYLEFVRMMISFR